MLRTLLAVAAAVTTLSVIPAANAETVNSGDVTVFYSYDEVEIDGFAGEAETDTIGVTGRYALPLQGNLGLQLDATYANADTDGGGDSDTVAGTVHFFNRNDSLLIGGFIGAADNDDGSAFGGGGELEFYLPRTTLGGRFTYANLDGDGGGDGDIYQLDGQAKVFFTDNLAGAVTAGIGTIESDGGGDADTFSIGANGEWKPEAFPVSFLAGVNFTDLDQAESTAFTIGARWNFGQQSLKARNRTGADLAPLTVGF